MRLFAFRLAKELGRADVDELLAEMPLPLMFEWMEYAKREPFGEERADLRMGIVACVIANAWRGKHSRPFRPDDFMPKFNETRKQQTPEQVHAMLGAFTAAQNEHVRRKNG